MLQQPGRSLDDVFNQVRARVSQRSASQQIPWSSSSVTGTFYFEGAPAGLTPTEPADEAAWNAVRGKNRVDLLEQFVKEYPHSSYASAARLEIKTLSAEAEVVVAPAAEDRQKASDREDEIKRCYKVAFNSCMRDCRNNYHISSSQCTNQFCTLDANETRCRRICI